MTASPPAETHAAVRKLIGPSPFCRDCADGDGLHCSNRKGKFCTGILFDWKQVALVEALLSDRDSLAAENERLTAELRRVEADNFALAANQCAGGYGDDYGNHRCRLVETAEGERNLAESARERSEAALANLRKAMPSSLVGTVVAAVAARADAYRGDAKKDALADLEAVVAWANLVGSGLPPSEPAGESNHG